jgi:DNA-directed RNA polymerase subunit RPC12/RpoP
MRFRSFFPDRRCHHCGSAASLYLEHIHGESDAVCILCGYRRTGVLRCPPNKEGRRATQATLPIPAGSRERQE